MSSYDVMKRLEKENEKLKNCIKILLEKNIDELSNEENIFINDIKEEIYGKRNL